MPTIDDVKAFLVPQGIEVWEFAEPTPTCETAAAAVGCQPAQIAKSVLLLVGENPVLVVTCGDTKVKSSKLKKAMGLSGKVRLPEAQEVMRHTGYAPGGVCPFLLSPQLPVLLDESLARHERVYAAAGTAHSAVPVTLAQLKEITRGGRAEVCDLISP